MSTPVRDRPSFDSARFRHALGHFATGLTIVTALSGDGPVGFTCQSFTSLSLDPPMIALAPGKASRSWPRIREAGAFCVNVLDAGQQDLCTAFATSGGDKFAAAPWSPGRNGAPRLAGSLAHVECRLVTAHDAGDHELVIGAVEDIEVHDGEPLLFYRGAFAGLSR
ncbi:monooxygenase [Kitasatospora sp. NE20-6]|uniref:flavin reductase family protein n=1 Tax=Kitasatospora sp. NE20-6 TaxID=2859066 RepID=UPI0034DBDA01